MRRVIIWILVIILVFGFVYVGNNVLANYTSPKISLLEYIPEVPFLLKFNKQNLQTAKAFYSFPSFISSLDFNRAYIITNGDSPLFAFNTKKDASELLRTVTENLKSQNKFSLKKKWEKGFLVLYAYNKNEKYFISGWRNFIFMSKNLDALYLMFNGITGQEKHIINDSSFQKLWDRNNDFECFVRDGKHNVLKNKVSIPFYRFSYPMSFTMNNNTIQMYCINNQGIENSLIPAYHFENAVAEISSHNIIPYMDNGLAITFNEKTGIFYDKFAVVFSDIPSELVIFNGNEFSLIFSSNPANNVKLGKQLRELLPEDVKVKSKMLNNYTITQYTTQDTNVYVLTTKNFFIISTKIDTIPITISSDNFKNAILLIKVKKSFNNVISFYNLFLDKLSLPNDFTECSLIETNSTKEGIVKIEIILN